MRLRAPSTFCLVAKERVYLGSVFSSSLSILTGATAAIQLYIAGKLAVLLDFSQLRGDTGLFSTR